jgi:hypothetical protein
LHKRSF